MKIYLLDRDEDKTEALKEYFENESDVEIVCDDFESFMRDHDVECIVSPANSFGLMDGGYDLAITNYFGRDLQEKVQKYIIDNFYGMQPVGTSFICDIDGTDQKLIHTPSMCYPSRIKDPFVVYQCMRTTLMTALENDAESIVIPVFGGLTGGMDAETCARLMWLAYRQITEPLTAINWNTVEDIADSLALD